MEYAIYVENCRTMATVCCAVAKVFGGTNHNKAATQRNTKVEAVKSGWELLCLPVHDHSVGRDQ